MRLCDAAAGCFERSESDLESSYEPAHNNDNLWRKYDRANDCFFRDILAPLVPDLQHYVMNVISKMLPIVTSILL